MSLFPDELFDKVEVRECLYCKINLPLSSFSKNKNNYGGYDNRCKSCSRKRSLEVEAIRKIAPPKPDKCECCGRENSLKVGRRKFTLNLDHDPISKTFRGWICRDCNTGIGLLGDNLESIERVYSYMTRTKND